jgi:chromosome segregation ATPase
MAKKKIDRDAEAQIIELENEFAELEDRYLALQARVDEKDQALADALRQVLLLETALIREREEREKLRNSLL